MEARVCYAAHYNKLERYLLSNWILATRASFCFACLGLYVRVESPYAIYYSSCHGKLKQDDRNPTRLIAH